MGKPAATKKVLTDKGLKALKPAEPRTRYWVWDAQTPNLGVRVTEKGSRSFFVVRRGPDNQHLIYHRIGRYPDVSLVDARKQAPIALTAISKGQTAEDAERERIRAEGRHRKDTFATVAEDFIKKHVAGLRRAKETENLIRAQLIERWGPRPARDISRSDIIEAMDEIIENNGPNAARHAFAAARKLFNWALHRDVYGLEQSPCARIKTVDVVGQAPSRDRVLSDDELRLVWEAAKGLAYPFGTFVQMLVLTGQRLHEISDARWEEITDNALVLPVERMKAKRTHTVPLTPFVLKLLDTIPIDKDDDEDNDAPRRGYIFTTTGGERPIGSFSKAKARLDEGVAAAALKVRYKRDIPHFTYHDLRRTVRTRLSSLGILPVIAELVIGHTQKGIHAVYDRHTYDNEKRAALLKWEGLLLSIVAPPPKSGGEQKRHNVVEMRGRRAANVQ